MPTGREVLRKTEKATCQKVCCEISLSIYQFVLHPGGRKSSKHLRWSSDEVKWFEDEQPCSLLQYLFCSYSPGGGSMKWNQGALTAAWGGCLALCPPECEWEAEQCISSPAAQAVFYEVVSLPLAIWAEKLFCICNEWFLRMDRYSW